MSYFIFPLKNGSVNSHIELVGFSTSKYHRKKLNTQVQDSNVPAGGVASQASPKSMDFLKEVGHAKSKIFAISIKKS